MILPVGARLLGLAGAGAAVYLIEDLRILGGAALASAALAIWARPEGSGLVRTARWPLALAGMITLAHGLSGDWRWGAVAGLRLFVLMALAWSVTATTPTAAMTAAFERGLRPLERLGMLDAAKVSMAATLALRFAPMLGELLQTLREAQAARGGGGIGGLLGAFLGQSLRKADLIAEAMDARGWPPEPR